MGISINTKISEPFETFLELLSDDIFDAGEKPEITEKLVSFDEVMTLELQWMVDLIAEDDLFCRLLMDALIFSEYSISTPFQVCL